VANHRRWNQRAAVTWQEFDLPSVDPNPWHKAGATRDFVITSQIRVLQYSRILSAAPEHFGRIFPAAKGKHLVIAQTAILGASLVRASKSLD
jgi:hypothetical protein